MDRLPLRPNANSLLTFIVASAVVVLTATVPVQAGHSFTVVINFTDIGGAHPGANPYATLIQDGAGTIYGTTSEGGAITGNHGTMFAFLYGTHALLHSFSFGLGNPTVPVAGLLRGSNGNLYGTTQSGGSYNWGTVFSLTPTGVFSILYNFTGGTDGGYLLGGVVRDAAGNLYGTTSSGGSANLGTVFKLTPSGTETVLHNFSGPDGQQPYAGLTLEKTTGTLYGVAQNGGGSGNGVIFSLASDGTYKVLHSFTVTEGAQPLGMVVEDSSGNLYGTTSSGGNFGNGTLWQLTPGATLVVLHQFAGGTSDGATPYAGVVRDSSGNLYGTTLAGGAYGSGTLYELKTGGTFILLHSFDGSVDGCGPEAVPFRDGKGTLWGTARGCGPSGYGTVWKY